MGNIFHDIAQANFTSVNFLLDADGTTPIVKVNLTKPPFLLDFKGAIPDRLIVQQLTPYISGTAVIEDTIDGAILTVTYSENVPSNPGEPFDVVCAFGYNSLT